MYSLTFLCFLFQNHKHDSSFVAKINKLERELLIAKKEAAMFQDRLQTAEIQVR